MFVEYFLKRPVVVVTLVIIICIAGTLSFSKLPYRLFPSVDLYDVQVTTIYSGANAKQMRARITIPIEESINDIDGVTHITSTTKQGVSIITVHIKIGGDFKHIFASVLEKVKSVQGLPSDMDVPKVKLIEPERAPDLAIAFFSDLMQREQVSEYLTRVLKPKLESIKGISTVNVLGSKYALRIWLDPLLMEMHNIDSTQIILALNQQNVFATTGEVSNKRIHLNIESNTAIENIEDFKNIAIHYNEDGEIKLGDIAQVELGTYNESLVSLYNGISSTVVSAKLNSNINPLIVIDQVKNALQKLKTSYPYDLKAEIIVDSTEYIKGALKEVALTILFAVIIVFITLFLFTGTLRAVLIPLVTIPLSQLGVFIVLFAFGYSLNSLTLLALVLAIGIVVDDAIVVYDNILSKFDGSVLTLNEAVHTGAKEIFKPVIAITLTFVTVYIPIMFMGGVIEHLFTEFAITLAGSVLISGLIALILTPLMCKWLIVPRDKKSSLSIEITIFFDQLKIYYGRSVIYLTRWYGFGMLLWLIGVVITFLMFNSTGKELVTKEDQGLIMVLGSVASYQSTEFINEYNNEFQEILNSIEEIENYNYITGIPSYNQFISFVRLKNWGEREKSAEEIQQILSNKLSNIAGVKTVPIIPSYLPGTSGLPFQLVIKHKNSDYKALDVLTNLILIELRKTNDYKFLISDLHYDTPYKNLKINRYLAKKLGVNINEIAKTLSLLYSNQNIQKINYQNKSYDVIVKIKDEFISNTENLKKTMVRNNNGVLIPLSTFVDFENEILPNSLNTFQKQGSVTLSGILNSNVRISDALSKAKLIVHTINPSDISIDYAGETRQFVEENDNSFLMIFVTIIMIFMFLVLLYGNASDATIIVLGSIPLSTFGSLLYLNLNNQTLNIFTYIAMLTMVGLITKHGILMVRKAESLILEESLNYVEAINKACVHRFRAILMTTISMVIGALPLYYSQGPGAISREQIGGVIIWGMLIGTTLTLYILPSLYVFFNKTKYVFSLKHIEN